MNISESIVRKYHSLDIDRPILGRIKGRVLGVEYEELVTQAKIGNLTVH